MDTRGTQNPISSLPPPPPTSKPVSLLLMALLPVVFLQHPIAACRQSSTVTKSKLCRHPILWCLCTVIKAVAPFQIHMTSGRPIYCNKKKLDKVLQIIPIQYEQFWIFGIVVSMYCLDSLVEVVQRFFKHILTFFPVVLLQH